MTSIEKKVLGEHLETLSKIIEKHSDVPQKAMTDYTVDDIVNLRVGYEMIVNEIVTIKDIFVVED